MTDELDDLRREVDALIARLDDLVLDALREQLRGGDREAEKRLSRARNALRRASSLLGGVELDDA